jgi:PPP family 3-phenylpropionic acid transporter
LSVPVPAAPRPAGGLAVYAAVSFAYYGYAGLFATYGPLWLQSLGYSTFAIGALLALQSTTRLVGPYAWAWVADASGRRIRVLRVAAGAALVFASGFLTTPSLAWVATVTAALFLTTAAIIPLSEAALAQRVSVAGALDQRLYGRVRVGGSAGFVVMVAAGGFALDAIGVGAFPGIAVALLGVLLVATLRMPQTAEAPHADPAGGSALAVLRRPVVAWFFAGMFLTILAHAALYGFYALYLASLGYSKGAIGLLFATGVVAEIAWFWFQSGWIRRLSTHGWLIVAAVASALRFGAIASYADVPAMLVLLQLLHALTFAAQHAACVALISRYFPGRLRGRGQALYAAIGYGASGMVGGMVGGALSQAYGFGAVFWAASAAGVAAALCCWRAWVLDRDPAPV